MARSVFTAKGRVERAFQTLQDRLVKALRLAGIDTVAAANAWLPGSIAHYNARFGKTPKSSQDAANRALEANAMSLRWITSEQHPLHLVQVALMPVSRTAGSDSAQGGAGLPPRAARITVCDDGSDDAIVLLHQGRPLLYRVFARHDLPPRIADDKTVDACVEAASQQQAPARPNHPQDISGARPSRSMPR